MLKKNLHNLVQDSKTVVIPNVSLEMMAKWRLIKQVPILIDLCLFSTTKEIFVRGMKTDDFNTYNINEIIEILNDTLTYNKRDIRSGNENR